MKHQQRNATWHDTGAFSKDTCHKSNL